LEVSNEVKFFKEDYDRNNPICDGTKCTAVHNCIMKVWDLDKPGFVETETRRKIIQKLAEITVKANQEIAELFNQVKNASGAPLPKESPTFKLVMIQCPSQKFAETDYGD